MKRCRELASDSRGAALAMTLAFLTPIYLMVLGVFGVGEIVRNKIELQNAADAAAYSASVVQADYLSRMATINQAMAWTYVDLQKRSLDLAMASFSEFVFAQFQKDLKEAKTRNLPCHMHTVGVHYNCGTDILVLDLTLRLVGTGVGIPELAKKFNGQGVLGRFLLTQIIFTTVGELKGKGMIANEPKVLKYSRDIIAMMKELNNLKKEYSEKLKSTAREIAVANMVECKDDYIINVTTGDDKMAFLPMPGTEQNEKDFIAMADPTLRDFSPKKVFGPGTDDWIVQKSPIGFWRVYRQTDSHLYAKWDVFWTAWRHIWLPWPLPDLHLPPFTSSRFDHKHPEYHGYDNFFPLIKQNLPIGLLVPPAIPQTLLPTFFGKAGTITVAIARKTSNPLSFFAGRRSMTAPGMLSAFDPSVAGGHRPEYMCAIASARAGYKQYQENKKQKLDSADYCIGYSYKTGKESWNLRETDWDGVLLPVRHAWDLCAGTGQIQMFTVSSDNILSSIMLDKKNWVDKNGQKVSGDRLPDWEKLQPPGGLVVDGGGGGQQKLKWDKLRDYLGH